MMPTSMAFTSTLCGANSCDSALVIAMPAPRDIEVGMLLGRGALAPMLRTLMMRPQRRSFIWGVTSRINRTAANSFSSRSSYKISSGDLLEWHRPRRSRIVDDDVDLIERLHHFVVGTLDVGRP